MTAPSRSRPHTVRLTLVAILLLAFFLRVARLDAQSFWNDEGNSARIAERPLELIWQGAAGDIHPPGYYLLLHTWRSLVGHSEFALRYFSVAAGLLAVVFTYLLGRQLFDASVGLMAAFLGALSPLAVYYAQEARMYALLGAISGAATYLLLRFTSSETGGRPLLAYTFLGAAGLYTQYAFPFVLLVHQAIFGLWWLTEARRSAGRWRRLALWAGAQVVILALYLPWLPTALKSVTGWSSAGRAYELGPAIAHVLHVLCVGVNLPEASPTAVILALGWVLLVQWVFRSRGDGAYSWFSLVSAALYLLLPITLIFAFDLYKPEWLKFLVVVLPPFHVLAACGVVSLFSLVSHRSRAVRRVLRVAFPVLLGALFLPSLYNLYFAPAYARDDYRQITVDLSAAVRPGDAIILNAPNQWEVFTYYYPDRDVYPAPYRPEPGEVERFLLPLFDQYERLFVLYWGDAESDPRRLIETRLAEWAYKAGDRWYGRVRFSTYGVGPRPEQPLARLDARFGEAIRLEGYALPETRCAPGDVLPVALFWRAESPVAERYKVTVQLLDGGGQLAAQQDTEPRDGLLPTDTWSAGQAVTDRYGVALPPGLPPGRYTLVVALYHVTTGERLPVTIDGTPRGDYLIVTEVEVAGSLGDPGNLKHLPSFLPRGTLGWRRRALIPVMEENQHVNL
ncbi:MAG TPA: hypothetical protein ENN99_14180 [Chloroflexi bacterium]|nr:hypothetical protein [Chloroflexota bacterium]